MTRKTLIWIIVTLLCLMQTGCFDSSYHGLHNVTVEQDEVNPQKVLMFIGSSTNIQYQDKENDAEDDSQNEETKGTGVIGSLEGFTGKSFNVYSFLARTQETSYKPSAVDESIFCLIDGSLDDPESVMGREAIWRPESNLIEWKHNPEPVYYPLGEALGLTYDFFAYYVDDMELSNENFHRNDDSVVIDIEIDGSQDIMSAVAVPAEEELWFGTEDPYDYSYRKQCTYSYYTAQLNIHPRFIFKHHLAKLDFKFVPGVTPGINKDVKVEKVEVYSKTKADFVVAHKMHSHVGYNMGVFFKGEKTALELKEKDGAEFNGRIVQTAKDKDSVKIIDDTGSFLLAPDEDYELYLHLTEYRNGEKISNTEITKLNLYLGNGSDTDAPHFEAGNEYLITLTIFGKMDVHVTTELTKWGTGGDYEYDYDSTTRPEF